MELRNILQKEIIKTDQTIEKIEEQLNNYDIASFVTGPFEKPERYHVFQAIQKSFEMTGFCEKFKFSEKAYKKIKKHIQAFRQHQYAALTILKNAALPKEEDEKILEKLLGYDLIDDQDGRR